MRITLNNIGHSVQIGSILVQVEERAGTEPGAAGAADALGFPLAMAAIALDPTSPVPLYDQVCQFVRRAIWSGELPAGTLLPTCIELAGALGIARNTAHAAYSRLGAEGYLVANKRRGTRVANDPPRHLQFNGQPHKPPPQRASVAIGFYAQRSLALPLAHAFDARPLAPHATDAALHSRPHWNKLLADRLRGSPGPSPSDIARGECRHFQESVASYFRSVRGACCEPAQVIATTGIEAALDLVARVMLDPGHSVLIEDPALDIARAAFASAGARLVTMPSDAHGANPKQASGPPPRLIFVSPSVSFPLGVQMPEARRVEILDYARASSAAIFENDGYGELLYTGPRLRVLQGCDPDDRVLYYTGFTATLGPTVRVGFLVVPPALTDSFREMARRIGQEPDWLVQDTLAAFIEAHAYTMQVKKARAAYAGRLELMKEACRTHLPDIELSQPQGGLHLVLHLDESADDRASCERIAANGLAVSPLSHCYLHRGGAKGLVLGFGGIPERMVEPVIRRLAEAMR